MRNWPAAAAMPAATTDPAAARGRVRGRIASIHAARTCCLLVVPVASLMLCS